jgi:uncharacterized membrane protein
MLNFPVHFLIVHFPIALAIIAVVYDARGYRTSAAELHRIGYTLVLWAAAGAALAVATGLQLTGGSLQASGGVLHAAAGLGSLIMLIALAVLRYSAEARETEALESFPALWLVLEVAAGLAVIAAAITGHRLVLGR